jgi:hypothetical protein
VSIRKCTRCGLEKPRTGEFFPPHKGMRDGLGSYCRSCKSAISKRYQQGTLAIRAERERARRARLRAAGDARFAVAHAQYRQQPHALVALRLARRMAKVLGRKVSRAEMDALTGCVPRQLAAHLEAAFQPGMCWENSALWHIDHVRPLAAFDLSDPAQLADACHFSNLQPLWAADNVAKGNAEPP